MFCRGLDVTPITLSLSGAAAYPRACQALASMLSRNALNPADITVVSIYWILNFCFDGLFSSQLASVSFLFTNETFVL